MDKNIRVQSQRYIKTVRISKRFLASKFIDVNIDQLYKSSLFYFDDGEEWISYTELYTCLGHKKAPPLYSILCYYLDKVPNANISNTSNLLILEHSIRNYFEFENYYNDNCDYSEVEILSKTHSFFYSLVGILNSQNLAKREAFELYTYFACFLSFKTGNYKSFLRKLGELRNGKIENVLIHGNKGKSKARVLNDKTKLLIQSFGDLNKYSITEIVELVKNISMSNPEINSVSVTSAHRALSQRTNIDIQTGLYLQNEKSYLNNNLPKRQREPAKNAMEEWQIDSASLQFWFKDESDRLARLYITVILDVYSKEVVAYDLSTTENSDSIIQCLRNAVVRVGYLPRMIISDNGSSYKSKQFKSCKEAIEEAGVNWVNHKPYRPTGKGNVEVFFNLFESKYCKKIDGFIGHSITSKKHEKINIDIKVKRRFKSKKQLEAIIHNLIETYCTDSNYKLGSRKMLFENSSCQDAIYVDEAIYARAFYKSRIKKVTSGTIVFKLSDKNYRYQLLEDHLFIEYTGQDVNVYFDDLNMDKIYLFDLSTQAFITSLYRIKDIPRDFKNYSLDDNMYSDSLRRLEENVSATLVKNRELNLDALKGIVGKTEIIAIDPESGTKKKLSVMKLFNSIDENDA